jgi:hypothetical protein
MKCRNLIITILILFIDSNLPAQDAVTKPNLFPAGLTMKYGTGHYSHKDEYISGEKYTGMMPFYSLEWARSHERYVYQLEMIYRHSSGIRNHHVSADITQFMMSQGFIYPLREMLLFKKDLFLWIGPSSELYFFYNKPEIAVSGFDYAQSYAMLASLGLNAEGILPLNQKFNAESSVHLTVVSVGGRMVDNEEDGQSPVRLLTLLSGLNSSFSLGVRYQVFNPLTVRIAYRFEFTRISKWTPLLAASDNATVALTYRF